MKYPFFASFIVLCLLLMYEIHKARNREAQKYQSFLDEEAKANATRRQSLEDLQYITIPFETLPTDILTDDERISEYLETLHILSETKIVNFTGLSNTELKLKYGAPNIDILSQYDANYTSLVRTLNDWAHLLYQNGYASEARTILEFAISTNTDISTTYNLLAQIYKDSNETEKIKELIPIASGINSLMSKSIVKNLERYFEE